MPLLYKPVQNTIASQDGKKKWRPTLVKFNKQVTTKEIAQELAEMSAQTPGDSYNLIKNLGTVMKRYLLNSFSVNLEGLGSFTIIAKSKGNGVDTAEEVKPSQINNLRVQFTPTSTKTLNGSPTRSMTEGVKFELYGSQSEMVVVDKDNNDGNQGGNQGGAGDGNDGQDDWSDPST